MIGSAANRTVALILAALGTMPPRDALRSIPTSVESLPTSGPTVPLAGGPPSVIPSTATAAAAMCNLLPFGGGANPAVASTGLYIGEGLPPVPLKLVEKIRRWEFIDMSELLSGFWGHVAGSEHDEDHAGIPRPSTRRGRKVTDMVS